MKTRVPTDRPHEEPTAVKWSAASEPVPTLQNALSDVLQRRIAQCTALVAFFDEVDVELKHGTGVCVQIAQRRFVATAAHHFVQQPLPHRVSLWSPHLETTARVPVRDVGHRLQQPIDIAWLELEPLAAEGLGQDFVPLSQMDPGYRSSDCEAMFFFGFTEAPKTGNEIPGIPEFATVAHLTHALDIESITSEHRADASSDLFVRYTRTPNVVVPDGYIDRLPRPHGLSGAGVWRINLHAGWSLNDVKLIAIEHEEFAAAHWLRCTRIRHWLDLVRDAFPDTANEIDAALLPGA